MRHFDYFFVFMFKAFFMTALTFISAILLMTYVVMLFGKESYISAVCLAVFGLPITALVLSFVWEFIDGEN